MSLQTILIIGGILTVVAIAVNIFAFFLEKSYKKKMNKMANKN